MRCYKNPRRQSPVDECGQMSKICLKLLQVVKITHKNPKTYYLYIYLEIRTLLVKYYN